MALTARLRSVLSDARERAGRGDDSDEAARPGGPGGADRTESSDVPETNLYECSTCDTVYVAEEKSSCSTCGEDVEQVSSTLSRE